MGPAGWPRLGEGRGETGGGGRKGGGQAFLHLPGAGGLEGKRLLTTPGERTAEASSHGEVSGGCHLGSGAPPGFTEDEPQAERLGGGGDGETSNGCGVTAVRDGYLPELCCPPYWLESTP